MGVWKRVWVGAINFSPLLILPDPHEHFAGFSICPEMIGDGCDFARDTQPVAEVTVERIHSVGRLSANRLCCDDGYAFEDRASS